jgi:hypothetical protein
MQAKHIIGHFEEFSRGPNFPELKLGKKINKKLVWKIEEKAALLLMLTFAYRSACNLILLMLTFAYHSVCNLILLTLTFAYRSARYLST